MALTLGPRPVDEALDERSIQACASTGAGDLLAMVTSTRRAPSVEAHPTNSAWRSVKVCAYVADYERLVGNDAKARRSWTSWRDLVSKRAHIAASTYAPQRGRHLSRSGASTKPSAWPNKDASYDTMIRSPSPSGVGCGARAAAEAIPSRPSGWYARPW